MNRKDASGVEYTLDWLEINESGLTKIFLSGPPGFRALNAETEIELKVGDRFKQVRLEREDEHS